MYQINRLMAVAGVLALGASVSSPALAGPQAYASGSSSFVLTSGFSQSIGAEIAAPQGTAFEGATAGTGDVTATAAFIDNTSPLANTANVFESFDVDPGQATGAVSANANVEAAVAGRINTGPLNESLSFIRAWQSGAGLQ